MSLRSRKQSRIRTETRVVLRFIPRSDAPLLRRLSFRFKPCSVRRTLAHALQQCDGILRSSASGRNQAVASERRRRRLGNRCGRVGLHRGFIQVCAPRPSINRPACESSSETDLFRLVGELMESCAVRCIRSLKNPSAFGPRSRVFTRDDAPRRDWTTVPVTLIAPVSSRPRA